MSKLDFETNITARFHSITPLSPMEQVSLNALNAHAAEMAERLQTVVRLLLTEMLDIKREQFTRKEENHAGSEQTYLSSNDRTDSGAAVRKDTEL